MNESASTEKSLAQKVVDKIKNTFVPDNTPYGKRDQDQVGNNLFQDCVVGPFKAASAYNKALGPRKLTPHQQKVKAKNRAKRKAQKASRRGNR